MTIATVQFMSQALWRQVTYTALLPDETVVGPGPYVVLYQLHGGNPNHTAWLHASNLLHYTQVLPFIVILPDGAQSRWATVGPPFTAYEDFLVEELSQHVRHTFPATSGKWAVGGNSMGGFGAVRLGLKYPQDDEDLYWTLVSAPQPRLIFHEPARFAVTVQAVKQGCNVGHSEGDRWELSRSTPTGICSSAFHTMYPVLHGLNMTSGLDDGPAAKDTLVSCPDGGEVTFRIERHLWTPAEWEGGDY